MSTIESSHVHPHYRIDSILDALVKKWEAAGSDICFWAVCDRTGETITASHIAYADDVILLASGMTSQRILDDLETALTHRGKHKR